MRKNIRRVIDKSYDVYKPEDYSVGADNLNPVREVPFETRYEEILSVIQGKIKKQYKAAGVEYEDEDIEITAEGLDKDIDNLLNLFNKNRNPTIGLKEMGIDLSQMMTNNGTSLEALTNQGLAIDCFGTTTVTGADNAGAGNGDGSGDELNGLPCRIKYISILEKDGNKSTKSFETLQYSNDENPEGAKQGEIIALYAPTPTNKDVEHQFVGWYLDEKCTLAMGKKLQVKGKKVDENSTELTIYALFRAPSFEDITDPITIIFESCEGSLFDNISDWSNPNNNRYIRGGKKLLALQGQSKKGMFFKGWFRDSFAATGKIEALNDSDITYYAERNKDNDLMITVYAKFTSSEEDEADESDPYTKDLKDSDFRIDGCDFVELQILKVILVMVKIVKLLVTIISTILGILIPLINLVKEAQLAWINPPFMMSIINQITERLMSVLFMLIGTILAYLWQMLNFECISENSLSILSQISTTLAGIDDAVSAINEIALVSDDVKKAISVKDTLKEKIESLKEEAEKQIKEFPEMMKALSNSTYQDTSSYIQKLSDPKFLYSKAVPSEVQNTVNRTIQAVKQTQKTYTNLVTNLKNLTSKSEENRCGGTTITPL